MYFNPRITRMMFPILISLLICILLTSTVSARPSQGRSDREEEDTSPEPPSQFLSTLETKTETWKFHQN